ncbi:MAG: hypothetical protein H6832_19085 [Planctomycetes bacterium]|nr:hypothetical protein [Planctomycetota bacterium]
MPQVAASVDGNRWIATHFREAYGRRVQLVIAPSHLSQLTGKRIHELAFRKDVKYLRPYRKVRGGEQTRVRIVASWSDADPAKPSLTYSNNHGPSPVVVFDGLVTLPKVSDTDTRPVATFDPREAPTIPFQTLLPHVAGKSLVLDFTTYGGNAGYKWDWPVDAQTNYLPGTTTKIGATCWPSKWSDNVNIVKGSLRPGMHIKTDCAAPPNPAGAFLIFGLSDKFAFGSIPLPLRLAQPNCDLYVSPDVISATLFYQGPDGVHGGWTGAVVPTPYQSSLHGATLYFQYLFLHTAGSQLELKTSHAVAATLAPSPASLGVSLVASLDPTAANGRIFLDFTPVMQLSAK